jgi:hypothetical protein
MNVYQEHPAPHFLRKRDPRRFRPAWRITSSLPPLDMICIIFMLLLFEEKRNMK